MIGFAAPAWLFGLLLVPVIWYLHRSGPTLRRVPVASLELWRDSPATAAHAGRVRRPDPAWRRRAAVAALLSIALAAPQWQQATPRLTLWLDDSLSMRAQDGGVSRLEQGIALARAAAREAGARDVIVRPLSDPARSHASLDEGLQESLRRATDAQEPVLPPPVALGADREHWLVTDGADAAVNAWAAQAPVARALRVTGQARNVGIARLTARTQPADRGTLAIQLHVVNGGDSRESRTLQLSAGSTPIGSRTLELGPGESALLDFSAAVAASTITARLAPFDALVDDDALTVDTAAIAPLSVALDDACPGSIRRAVRAHPALAADSPSPPGLAIDCSGTGLRMDVPTVRFVPGTAVPVDASALVWSGAADPLREQLAGRLPARANGALSTVGATDQVLLAEGAAPLIVAHVGTPRIVETTLDAAAPGFESSPGPPMLVGALADVALDTRLLSRFASAGRGEPASRVAPQPEPLVVAGVASSAAPAELPAAPLLLLVLALIAWDGLLAARRLRREHGAAPGGMNAHAASLAIAVGLRAAALLLLALVVAGRPWPAPGGGVDVVLLTDRSASVSAAEVAQTRQETLASLRSAGARVRATEIGFAGRPGSPQPVSAAGRAGTAAVRDALEPQATDLQSAVLAALAGAGSLPHAIVVLSDGHATQGDGRLGLEAAAHSGVPVLWRTVSPDVSAPRIVATRSPPQARPGQRVPVTVQLGGTAAAPVAVTVRARDRAAAPVAATLAPGPLGNVVLELQADGPGLQLLDVELTDATTGRPLDGRTGAAALEVRTPSDILVVAQGTSRLAESLRAGGWSIVMEPPQRLDALADGIAGFAAIVLDDVPYRAARPATWEALASAVHDDGTGLLVLGGARSFAAGGYRDSALEAILPVVSRPGSVGEEASFIFMVDKSGSMGASAAGVDRFRMAQRAVIDTAAALQRRDAAGLIVFDVAAREVVPLAPAESFRAAAARPWPAQPRGGTRLLPALELGVSRLEAAPAGRRFLVLVTDGFVIDGDDAALRERIARAGIELVALGVGPDADLATLRRLVSPERGTVLHVAEAAELPSLMRGSLERRRAPIERAATAVTLREPLPLAGLAANGWPGVAAYAVTGARPDATVHLESRSGDPLLASWSVGLGRVVAITAGLGTWAPEWLQWRHWPALAGGLAQWVSRDVVQPGWAAQVADGPSLLRVDVDTADDGRWSESTAASLRVVTPGGGEIAASLAPSAPGRSSASVPASGPGLYGITVASPRGAQRLWHLRRAVPEVGPLEPSSQIAQWRAAGLVRDWSADELQRVLAGATVPPRIPVGALLLVLALFLLGVAAERYFAAILRAWVSSNRPKPRSS